MRLSERVCVVMSGRLGCSLTDDTDCNSYTIDCGGPVVMIDAGSGLGSVSLAAQLRRDGVDPARLSALLLTHGHLDHSGGTAAIHAQFAVPVWASTETALALETADEAAISLDAARRAGIYPADARYAACSVQSRFTGGERITLGDCTIEAMRTPGHSRDMMTWLIRTPDELLAFPGDTVFSGGRILLSSTWDCAPADYARSLYALSELEINALFPGHGIWSLRSGSWHIAQCLPYLRALLLPPNLL